MKELEDKIEETTETVKALTPDCDKLDYILSASSGALCGILDVFLIGKPGESPLGDITDKWFANRTVDFAKLCGYKGDGSLSSAISFLEKKFKVPYDQSVGGGIFKELLNLTPDNHHFKSLGHNATLLGLFFSILNQLGVGPEIPFSISDESKVWSEFIGDEKSIELVKSYMYFKVRLMFEPPSNSSLVEVMNKNIAEAEWRLNVLVDEGGK